MTLKKIMIRMLTVYFTLVTLITVATLVFGLYFDPEATFGYEAFATPLIYGACGVIPVVIMYTRRELSLKEIFVRKVIQLICIEGLIFFVAFYNSKASEELHQRMILMGVSVFVIYVLVHVIDWIQNCASAKKMTEQLMALQEKCN